MTRSLLVATMIITAGCGDNWLADDDGVIDASRPDAPRPIDASPPIDAPPPDLTDLCGAEPVTLEEWEDCYHKRWCEWLVGCRQLNTYHDVQECLDRSDDVEGGRLSADRRGRLRAVEQGRASIDVAAFTQCLAETSDAHCNTAYGSVACATRFTGTAADDDTCFADVECASPGATCEFTECTESCCPGTCRPRFREGEVCDGYYTCEPGLRCNQICLSGDIGDPCSSNFSCDRNAWCGNDGTCQADLAPGAECTSLLQCGGDTSCIGLSIVDSSPGQCLPNSSPGDPCDDYCHGNLYCDASGSCRNRPRLGESCPGFTLCDGIDTICDNGLCILRRDEGNACSSNQPCRPGLFCTSELNDPNPSCTPPRVTGQPCTDPSHCESYLCSGDTAQPGVCLAWSDTCSVNGN